jgi:hypothetical protein
MHGSTVIQWPAEEIGTVVKVTNVINHAIFGDCMLTLYRTNFLIKFAYN